MKKHRISGIMSLILVLAMLMGMMAGCGSTPAADAPEAPANNDGVAASDTPNNAEAPAADHSKIANIALAENITSLDPHHSMNMPGLALSDMIYDTLVTSDHAGNYFPSIAERWDISEDGTVWTFHLRDDIVFSNGEVLNADDVVCTFERLLNSEGKLAAAKSYWSALKGVEKKDDYTVDLIFNSPYACTLMSCAVTYIISDESYAEFGDQMFIDGNLLGSGPWTFVEWVDGQYSHLQKNENYWGEFDSYFDEVYLRYVLETSTAISGQISGDIDANIIVGGIPVDLLKLFNGSEEKIDFISMDVGSFQYLGFQCGEGSVFHDKNVRLAVDYAIDRQGIADYIFGGGSVPNGLLFKGCVGYNPDYPVYEYNVEKAKEYLAKSSYNGEEITLSSNTSTVYAEEVLLAIAENMQDIGMNVKIEVVEGATLLDMRNTGNYDIYMVTATAAFGDQYDFLYKRIRNDIYMSHHNNQELIDLIDASNAELDAAKRAEILKDINVMLREECSPITMVTQHNATQAITKGITGIDLFTDGRYSVRWVSWGN